MQRLLVLIVLLVTMPVAGRVLAFCGFYAARADAKLFNKASQVVLVRNGDRTVLTMANDFSGNAKEFAVVIPVPTFITREQIHVADRALVEHLDAYSAPRLVEYFDANPCEVVAMMERAMPAAAPSGVGGNARAKSLGVTVEAAYTVGEYDIVILSATQNTGLETWLRENGYRIPDGAAPVLGSYLKQNMRFFVAKVNLAEQAKLGYSYLRPIQVAYESPKFMLPIRLGMLNADGPQDLIVYALTRKGRVETTNYRTVKLPTGMDVPAYVKEGFANTYRAIFAEQVKKEAMSAVFLEYAWDMAWCDPCAADPLSRDELRNLGVFWTTDTPGRGPAQDVFLTRLHVRYDEAHFPEDLVFQETADRVNFQGRYVIRQEWRGESRCEMADRYRAGLGARRDREAQTLATLTGWDVNQIRQTIKQTSTPVPAEQEAWWRRIWR